MHCCRLSGPPPSSWRAIGKLLKASPRTVDSSGSLSFPPSFPSKKNCCIPFFLVSLPPLHTGQRESCAGENGQLRPVRRCGCRGALQHLSIQFLPPGACAPRSQTAVAHRAKIACGIACGGCCVRLRTPAPHRPSSLTCACAA